MQGDSTVTFIVREHSVCIPRQALLSGMDPHRQPPSEEVHLPAWVTLELFIPLQKYILYHSLDHYSELSKDTTLMIHTLRLADHLGLLKMQERFISEVITPQLNVSNCVALLEETHRKLKNQENGSQCWYTLLNTSISFLASHLSQVHQAHPDKLRKLHEKILNEVLDRAIRGGVQEDAMVMELVLESRHVGGIGNLCAVLREQISRKKINPKIHAKLSWKLQDVANINDKRTKNFKFLELEWLLQAVREGQELVVKLTYTGAKRQACEIGVFYMKVVWWVDGEQAKREVPIHINYALMNRREELTVLRIGKERQTELGSRKVELSIFCCLEQVYTFTLNYLAKHHTTLPLDPRQLHPEELAILIEYLKQTGDPSAAVRFMRYYHHLTNSVPPHMTQDLPTHKLTPYELDFITKLNNPRPELPNNPSMNLRQSQASQVQSSQSRKSEERPQSRGRLRKIFAASPSRSIEESSAAVTMEDIQRIANIKNYFHDRTNQFYLQL